MTTSSTKPVHECLFCPQTFDSAATKDDHVLEHFAQETCTECNQNLIRIGSTLYAPHTASTCIKIEVKSEVNDQLNFDTSFASTNINQYDSCNVIGEEHQTTEETPSITAIQVDEIQIKDEIDLEYESTNTFESCNDFDEQASCSNERDESEISLSELQNLQVDGTVSHSQNKSNIDRLDVRKLKYKKDPVICDICKKVLSCKSALRTHTSLMHGPPSELKCQMCNMTFRLKGNLRKHMRAKHDPCAGKLKCKKCKRIYATESSLQSHRCKRPIPCNVCGKVLTDRRILKTHQIKFHSPPGTIFCHCCAKIFQTVENLSLHEATCKIKRQCDICGKVFGTSSALGRHNMLIHSPPETILCKVCAKLFSSIEERNVHKLECNSKKVHARKKNAINKCKAIGKFQCDVCELTFKLKGSLRRHKRFKHDA